MKRSPIFLAALILLLPSFSQAGLARITPPPVLEQDVLAFPPIDAYEEMNMGPVSRSEIDTLPDADRDSNAGISDAIEVVSLPQVRFPHNESSLSSEAISVLTKAARYIRDHEGSVKRILINGHADEVASEKLNYTLGEVRAYGVRQFLVASGVNEQLLHTSSAGEVDPIDENWTPSGRAHNRRVEVYILLSRVAP